MTASAAAEPIGQEVVRRHAVGNPCGADLPLRADESLRQRLLGDEERARDLDRREPADEPQSQPYLRFAPQRGMAAREKEL